ncbi:MAG: hypothetical protein WBP81_09690 [Solirubrobacteraceae bacterium]
MSVTKLPLSPTRSPCARKLGAQVLPLCLEPGLDRRLGWLLPPWLWLMWRHNP